MACFEIHKKIMDQNNDMLDELSSIIFEDINEDNQKLILFKKLRVPLEILAQNEHMVNETYDIVKQLNLYNNNINEDSASYQHLVEKYDALKKTMNSKNCLKQLYEKNENLKKIDDILKDIDVSEDKGDANESSTSSDDELTATQEINLIDPISKKLMVNPVRHVPCGHVYEKEVAYKMIEQTKTKFRCPTIGCTYRNPIKKGDLQTAFDYVREIQKKKRKGTYSIDN